MQDRTLQVNNLKEVETNPETHTQVNAPLIDPGWRPLEAAAGPALVTPAAKYRDSNLQPINSVNGSNCWPPSHDGGRGTGGLEGSNQVRHN